MKGFPKCPNCDRFLIYVDPGYGKEAFYGCGACDYIAPKTLTDPKPHGDKDALDKTIHPPAAL